MSDGIIGFLASVGVKVPDLVAGFAGGVVSAFVFHKASPASVVTSTVVGALTANYLADAATKFIGLSGGAAAFIVGLTAMAICQGIMEAVQKWKPGGPAP